MVLTWIGTGSVRATLARTALAMTVILGIAGCGSASPDYTYSDVGKKGSNQVGAPASANSSTIFGPGGLFNTNRPKDEQGGGGIGVNSFLWRASLDTVAFMPLASADPFGGVIITDWYTPQQTPNERFKVTVYILDRTLRADGIKVAVFRQARQGADQWTDQAVAADTALNLENAILARARQLRVDSAG